MRCPYIIGRDSWVKGYIKVLASPFPPRSGGMIPLSHKHYHHDITSRLIGLLLLLNVIVTYIYYGCGDLTAAPPFRCIHSSLLWKMNVLPVTIGKNKKGKNLVLLGAAFERYSFYVSEKQVLRKSDECMQRNGGS